MSTHDVPDPGSGLHEHEAREAEEDEVLTPEPDTGTSGVTRALVQVLRALVPLDLETAIKDLEALPLPGDPAERRAAAMNRADQLELVRAFLALRETGRGIVRRLEDDAVGKPRDE